MPATTSTGKPGMVHAFTGIIGLASLKDYQAGRIKPHEATLAKREQLFAAYLESVGFHAEPIL